MSDVGLGRHDAPYRAAPAREPDAASITATSGQTPERVLSWHVAFGLTVIAAFAIVFVASGVF